MPHAIRVLVATRISHIYLVSCWPPWTVTGRGWHRQFFNDLGLALAPKMVHDQSQAFEKVNHSQAFTVGWKKGPIFFSGRAASWRSKARLYQVQRFAQIYEELTAQVRRTNIKSNSTPEIEKTLKPRYFDAKPWSLYFNAQKSKCPRRFLERPWFADRRA